MTSDGDLTSDLLDLTTMSLAELRTTCSPDLTEAVQRELAACAAAPAEDIQGQNQ
ncbi:hypothetical protein [Saccharopolyspora flava]|uniref:FXSXX-COOH protein n=1 Tax=Saccharopolyspora flava TaxID=95161 RepID=A0A1I6SKQ2_9PSEU|nr:hypothetical protein [Saccharopolyspora flava]SFS77511.1 hypothetical protein SAMN05660874_03179 [Saccharopolyspora flava]